MNRRPELVTYTRRRAALMLWGMFALGVVGALVILTGAIAIRVWTAAPGTVIKRIPYPSPTVSISVSPSAVAETSTPGPGGPSPEPTPGEGGSSTPPPPAPVAGPAPVPTAVPTPVSVPPPTACVVQLLPTLPPIPCVAIGVQVG